MYNYFEMSIWYKKRNFIIIMIIISILSLFIFLHPKTSQSYLKPTLEPCTIDDCYGFISNEICDEKVVDELGKYEKCHFKCYGILLEMGNDCNYSGIKL